MVDKPLKYTLDPMYSTLIKIICSAEPTMFKLSPNLTAGLKVKVTNLTVVDTKKLLFPN